DLDTRSHAASSHGTERMGIPQADSFVPINPLVLAEDFTKSSVFSAHYADILEFESDLAQITELIILFCESVGSFTELGSFATVDEIAKRLLVVIRDFYVEANSFITLGPITSLRNKHDHSVYVIEDEVVGIKDNSHEGMDLKAFRDTLNIPLKLRFEKDREPTTFNAERPGHIIKLAVGLIQEYGALKFDEISETLKLFSVDVTDERLRAFLLCAKTVGWITSRVKGFDEFYVALDGDDAATFTLTENAPNKNRRRRRSMIREHWERNEPSRFRAITARPDGE
ncbi:hypothetical protein EDF58_1021, partial [Novosphingobium sp. PhB57]|uniref:retron St85 family effector protein n=1 Tax=Novosphingobium sp. PhB57 TaxID=2485107 RepID=UPI0010E7551B